MFLFSKSSSKKRTRSKHETVTWGVSRNECSHDTCLKFLSEAFVLLTSPLLTVLASVVRVAVTPVPRFLAYLLARSPVYARIWDTVVYHSILEADKFCFITGASKQKRV